MTNVQGGRALIMGGSSGIGKAAAELFALAGAAVVIMGRDHDRLNRAADEIDGEVTPVVVDATDAAQLRDFFATGEPFDYVVVCVSGGAGSGPFDTLDLADLRSGFEQKFWAQVQAVQAALPALTDTGSITLITAASARSALPNAAGLAAINGALEAMVAPLATEFAPRRINAVSPGIIDTAWWDRIPQQQRDAIFQDTAARLPAGRVGTPEEVAQAVFSVATNGFITGSVLVCGGGVQLATGR